MSASAESSAAASARSAALPPPAVGLSGSTTSTLGWQDPPAEAQLELVQVHYLVRHGERTPVRTRLLNSKPPIPARWDLCHAGKEFDATVLDLARPSKEVHALDWQGNRLSGALTGMRVRRSVESTDEGGHQILDAKEGECMLGELTDLGRASTNIFGLRLRELYVNRLGLLPPTLGSNESEKVYFRSTNMSRTIESLHSVVAGLLPETKTASGSRASAFVPTMLIRNGVTDNLLPNTFGCARLRDLDRQFAAMAAEVHNPKLAQLDLLISPHTDGHPPRIDGHPRLSGILDTVRAAKAHNIPVPAVFERPDVMELVEKAVCDEWYTGYRATDTKLRGQFRRLAMGRFLDELSGRLNDKAARPSKTPLQLAVYSTHDTSLAGLLGSLDTFDNRWPAFTASVGVELFKQRGGGGLLSRIGIRPEQHYVRMRYGDKEMRLPGCQASGDHLSGHEEFCTLQAFTRTVNAMRLPGTTWEQECEQR